MSHRHNINLEDVAFIIFKPDTVKQNMESSLWSFFKSYGISILGQKTGFITKEKRTELYRDFHLNSRANWDMGTQFYELGPALFLIVYKDMKNESLSHFITVNLKGNFVPILSKRGTVRGEFNSINPVFNLIHTSDSLQDTLREAQIFFERHELKKIITKRKISADLDLSYKGDSRERLMCFPTLFLSIKKKLAKRLIADPTHNERYLQLIQRFSLDLAEIVDRQERKKQLINFLDYERERFFLKTDPPLLLKLADHIHFIHLDFNALMLELKRECIELDPWEEYLLETSMYYIHFI